MKTQSRTALVAVAAMILLLIAIAAPSGAAASPAIQEAGDDLRLVTVTGEAEVTVVPDEVILTLGVETQDRSLAAAKAKNDAIVLRVLKAAEELGIEPRQVQTDYINIEPRYRDSERMDFLGYWVRKNVVITLKNVEAFEELLSDVLSAGANYVHGVEFRTTELRKHRDEARALAIRAAQEKAEALAGELGQEIGDPYRISEEYSGWWSTYGSWWGGRWGQSMMQNVIQQSGGPSPEIPGSTLAPGQISVTARVSVSFEMR